MPTIKFTDGAELNLVEGASFFEAFKAHDKDVLKKTVAVKVNGTAIDLSTPIKDSGAVLNVEPITLDSKEGLEILRHSASHIMAEAVKSLFKNVRLAIGPAIEDGFYYDFDVADPFTPEDLANIEKKMTEIIKGDYQFKKEAVAKKDALTLFAEMGETYKEELIREIPGDTVTIYRQFGFVDLCRGPHIPKTGMVKAFKLTSIAGAYWRGDETKPMLQRIYGTAFPDKLSLEDYLKRLEEAKKRDHRRLGKELDLFSMDDSIGAGLVLWHPNGAIVRGIMEDFWKKEHIKNGYSIIYTPHVAKLDLWKKSGHWDFYRENLYSPMDVEEEKYIVKPMNCPFHIQIYKTRLRSYRDLPIRYAELGTVYRYERSGVLHGLLRVRGFTQDDAHIYLAPGQLEGEIEQVLKFTLYILRAFGFNEYDVFLSTRPDKYVGALENWQKAESALKAGLERVGLKYSVDPGEGVFYGPKIDIKIKDVLNRTWQCSTIQVDFNLPERFDIKYRDEFGGETQPIMLHRALLGSFERFFGCLIEHYAGAFPVWLAPVQAIVIAISEKNSDYARGVFEKIKDRDLRVEIDISNSTVGYKIREARLRKIPYMAIVGDAEALEKTVAPRSRQEGELKKMPLEEFISLLEKENIPMGGDSL